MQMGLNGLGFYSFYHLTTQIVNCRAVLFKSLFKTRANYYKLKTVSVGWWGFGGQDERAEGKAERADYAIKIATGRVGKICLRDGGSRTAAVCRPWTAENNHWWAEQFKTLFTYHNSVLSLSRPIERETQLKRGQYWQTDCGWPKISSRQRHISGLKLIILWGTNALINENFICSSWVL